MFNFMKSNEFDFLKRDLFVDRIVLFFVVHLVLKQNSDEQNSHPVH